MLTVLLGLALRLAILLSRLGVACTVQTLGNRLCMQDEARHKMAENKKWAGKQHPREVSAVHLEHLRPLCRKPASGSSRSIYAF